MSLEMSIPESTRRAVARILWPTHTSALEDVLQSACLNVLKSSSRFEAREGCKYSTWFHRIAVNKALEHRRRSWRELTTDAPTNAEGLEYFGTFLANQPSTQLNPEERLLARERNRQLVRAILQLPPKMRQALLQWATNNNRQGQPSDSCLTNTEKARKFRAIRALRDLLGVDV